MSRDGPLHSEGDDDDPLLLTTMKAKKYLTAVIVHPFQTVNFP